MTKLTVGMPVFNDVDFVRDSIESLLNQTFTDFKLIISDDGSTDGSQSICEEFSIKDSRVYYFRQSKNLGISKNMEYLLSCADTKYFMWAGDDDLWDERFIESMIEILENNTELVGTFCSYSFINEEDVEKGKVDKVLFDYSSRDVVERLNKFILSPNDALGYGIYRTKLIKGVSFPRWWWPNHNCAYNNIFPTICYYLAKGDVAYSNSFLFFKRLKSIENVNHKLPFKVDTLAETSSYALRKLNLIVFSLKLISRADSVVTSFKIFPVIFNRWFFKPSYYKFKHLIKMSLRIKKKSNRKNDYLF